MNQIGATEQQKLVVKTSTNHGSSSCIHHWYVEKFQLLLGYSSGIKEWLSSLETEIRTRVLYPLDLSYLTTNRRLIMLRLSQLRVTLR